MAKNPCFTQEQIASISLQHYNLKVVSQKPFDSYLDQIALLITSEGSKFVMRISNILELKPPLEFQNAVMKLLSELPDLKCPKLLPTINGHDTLVIEGHFVRLIEFIQGTLFINLEPSQEPQRYYNLGASLAKMDKKLMEFEGEVLASELAWDARKFLSLNGHLDYVKNPEMYTLIQNIFVEYKQLQPKLSQLRVSLTHNDANDTNTIMNENGAEVLAFIDLGDVLLSYTINDLAVAAVYYILKLKDPLSALDNIVRGYNMVMRISPEELEMLPFLMRLRLSMSLLMSSYSSAKNPDNEYIVSSQKTVWELLKLLQNKVNHNYLVYRLRKACDYKFVCPQEEALVKFCASQKFAPILDFDFSDAAIFQLIDLSHTSELQTIMPKEVEKQTEFIFSLLEEKNKKIGVGRYNEERSIYTTENYIVDASERRTVHLGIDLFIKTGTALFCPYDAKVHSFGNSNLELDYGPVIILEHEVKDGSFNFTFFTLYGHLTEDSLKGLFKGKCVKKGEILGYVGSPPTNGNWPPHVHFQIINDMLDKTADFIGVAARSQRDLWLSICPDPNLVLQIPEQAFSSAKHPKEEILSSRKTNICRALSISYCEPLFIQRGFLQHLIDEKNKMYLDAVNNVAHIGHSHPKLQSVISKQFSLINTNTRYLSEELFNYTSELLRTFPKQLEVCFLTNSGSEANDLALRLARNHTQRKDVIVIDHAYHGNLTSLVDISPYKFQGKGGFTCPEFVHIAEIPDGYRGAYKYSDPDISKKYALSVEKILSKNPKKCAAFIAESVLGCGGQVILPKEYLSSVYSLVRNDGGVCIADEVQVGFGRVGSHMWAFETQGVVPDIVTLGKPIGNGYPMGAVITTSAIAENFTNGMEYFNTFGGSNGSCVVGSAVLQILKEEQLQERAGFMGKVLLDGLNSLKEKHCLIGDVRGLGMFVGIELVKNRETLDPAGEEASWISEYMKKEERVLISTDGPWHNVLKIKPPLCWGLEDCGRLVMGLDRALEVLGKERKLK